MANHSSRPSLNSKVSRLSSSLTPEVESRMRVKLRCLIEFHCRDSQKLLPTELNSPHGLLCMESLANGSGLASRDSVLGFRSGQGYRTV